MRSSKLYASIISLLVAMAGGSCGSSAPELSLEEVYEADPDYTYDNSFFFDSHRLGVKTAWSPANMLVTRKQVESSNELTVSKEFNFCYDAAPGSFDINQAAWMAFFSANAYSHFGYAARQAKELGFIGVTEEQRDWETCALNLKTVQEDQLANRDLFSSALGFDVLRDFLEKRFFANERWGACGKQWFESKSSTDAFQYEGNGMPAGAFTSWLLQNPRKEDYILFGDGGSWSFNSTTFESGSTQVMVFRRPASANTPSIVVVAFRGTEADQWSDISADLDFFKTSLETKKGKERGWGPGWGSVHRGFLNAYLSVDEQAKKISSFLLGMEERPHIYITGHSLGGALATILTSKILEDVEYQNSMGTKGLNLRGLYTFGSPRVGDATFVRRFNRLARKQNVVIGRVRNGHDLVTNMPKFRFEHVGPMFLLGEQVPGSDAADSTISVYRNLGSEPSNFLGDANDHSMEGYVLSDTNAPSYMTNDSGYYRRLREVLERSKDKTDPANALRHCD